MALVIEGEETIAAPIAKVWEGLNDPAILKACIPGCQTLEKKSDTEMAATVVLKIGPIKATFAGEVALKNLNPPHFYTITGEGKGGIAGFAKGGADVTLTETGLTSRLVSKARATAPILAFSSDERTLRRLALYWGVTPRALVGKTSTLEDQVRNTSQFLMDNGLVKSGERYVMIYGARVGVRGATNAVRVEQLP